MNDWILKLVWLFPLSLAAKLVMDKLDSKDMAEILSIIGENERWKNDCNEQI